MVLFLLLCSFPFTAAYTHLSYHGEPTQMTVTWTDFASSDNGRPYVLYGPSSNSMTSTAAAATTPWTAEGKLNMVRSTKRATMDGLTPGQVYYYSVGSANNRSTIFNFRAIDNSKPVRAAIFGDLGILNGHAFNPLISAREKHEYDIVFHIGDIAYDMNSEDGAMGDEFMKKIEAVAAYVPYMVIAGNHENSNNFNHLRNRFTMPSNGYYDDNQFWSITIGNTHFVGISSEYYGFHMKDEAQVQYQWLADDLAKNTARWTVVFMHRPMYCCTIRSEGCQGVENTITRYGKPGYPALEPLFNSAGVDYVFWGHMHTYERNYPVYKEKVFPQQYADRYHNAQTPVYILTGSAGCHDHIWPIELHRQPYTAAQLGEYGYSMLHVENDTQTNTWFVNAANSEMLDQFSLHKDPGWVPGQH